MYKTKKHCFSLIVNFDTDKHSCSKNLMQEKSYAHKTSSRLCKTVIDYDYYYFQFMKEDYHYAFIFGCETIITSRSRLQTFCLIKIANFKFDYDYKITRLRL